MTGDGVITAQGGTAEEGNVLWDTHIRFECESQRSEVRARRSNVKGKGRRRQVSAMGR